MNHCILLTPPGVAAIAVARLLGPGVESFLARHFSAAAKAGRCVHGQLADIDDPVVVLHDNRQTADVNLHGGTWIVHRFIELAKSEGFELLSGPHAAMAAADGDTLLAREIWSALPAARTELALRTLLTQAASWREFVPRAMAEPPGRSAIQSTLDDKALHWLLALPTVAIIGPANAGKSTLANHLFGQSHSIVADLPGTTRDWVGEIADIEGLAVMLVDTPGMRASADAIEQSAIAASRGRADAADLQLLVLDPTQASLEAQQSLLAEFSRAVPIINKSDRPPKWDVSATAGGAIRTIATTGQGLEAVRLAILTHFGCQELDPARPRWWTDRHVQVLRQAMEDPAALSRMIDE